MKPLACLFSLGIWTQLHAASLDPLRLDLAVKPVTQALELQLDPAQDNYTGLARVELLFEVATNAFRFHAKDIDLQRATIDGKVLALKAGEAGLVTATATEPLEPGLHRFEIAFANDYNRDAAGLYKTVAGGRPYLFTQMEPVDARRSFPCWDEPSFKIPWRITVVVPSELEAVGNMPIASSVSKGASKVVEFGRTPPMPSYLIALAIGPLDWIDIPGQAVPGRVYTAKGQSGLAYAAAKDAPPILAELERYFGLPYPYPKLDHIGVPDFMAGAMENVGAITYRDSILLFEEAKGSFLQRQRLSGIVAHEMAHMWFGDLVTMAWWDDLWLNESFATWMSYKAAGRVHPEQRFEFRGFDTALAARKADAKPSVKAIRRPFTAGDNLEEAFDVLSYNKGQGILRMIEGWLGEEKFRQALRAYFVRHAWGNARAEDLWAAFSEGGDPTLGETLRGFIEQPGIPHLSFKLLPGHRLEVRQQRYKTLSGAAATSHRWRVPIVVRHGGIGGEGTARLLLTNDSTVIELPEGQADWIYPNAGESGYYAWSLPSDLNAALAGPVRKRLGPIERLGAMAAADFSMQTGEIDPGGYLQTLLGFASDPEPEIKAQVIADLGEFAQTFAPAMPPEQRAQFEQLVRGVARPMLDQLGWEPKAGEAPELAPLRSRLLVALGARGNDPEVLAFCREMARRQIEAPRSVDAGIADAVLRVATWHGDAHWSEVLKNAFATVKEPDIRSRFRASLTYFRDPALARAGFDYLLSDTVRPSEVLLRRSENIEPEHAPVMFQWIVEKYDALKKKLPEDMLPSLARYLEPGDEALLARGREFFLDPARRTPLTEVHLRTAAEAVEQRAALRDRYGKDASKWLLQAGGAGR